MVLMFTSQPIITLVSNKKKRYETVQQFISSFQPDPRADGDEKHAFFIYTLSHLFNYFFIYPNIIYNLGMAIGSEE